MLELLGSLCMLDLSALERDTFPIILSLTVLKCRVGSWNPMYPSWPKLWTLKLFSSWRDSMERTYKLISQISIHWKYRKELPSKKIGECNPLSLALVLEVGCVSRPSTINHRGRGAFRTSAFSATKLKITPQTSPHFRSLYNNHQMNIPYE